MPLGFAGLLLPGNTPPWLVSVIEAAVAAGIGAGAIWLVGWLYEKIRHREGLGFGDVKMIAMIGAFLGLQGSLFTLLVGSFAGGVLGMLYIWLAKKDASTYELPFGTFLGIAAAAVAVWGEYLSRQIVAP
jgi:leader peptidase (prepilin peptidase)/N-methyltransferase